MITFSSITNTEKRSLEIPKERSSKFVYNVYCGDIMVGRTYGASCGQIIIYFPNKIARKFKLDDLKKIQKRSISLESLLVYGSRVV